MKGVDSSTVLFQVDDRGVLTLTLNRPERNNAWNRELEFALHDLLEQAAESDEVRVIVLTGAGRAFCPGLDSAELDRVSQPDQSYGSGLQRRPMQLPSFVPKPVICAINGACAGLGLITALASDVRFAAADAKITTAFVRRGLPAEEAVSWLLPRVIGHAAALDLLLSGRIVRGDEAAEMGLVHRALPGEELMPAVLEYARDWGATGSRRASASAKRQVYADWERSYAESRRDARRLVGVVKEAGDFREGVLSYVERRPAEFAPHNEAIDVSTMKGHSE
jgi:enoyl-CoA hydratase/carnithine racemase